MEREIPLKDIKQDQWYLLENGELVQVAGVQQFPLYGIASITGMFVNAEGNVEWQNRSVYHVAPTSERVVKSMLGRVGAWIHNKPEEALWNSSKKQTKAGIDPEMFLEDGKGVLIPAFFVLPDKDSAARVERVNFGYWDGFQAELNVSPSSCHDSLLGCTRTAMQQMLKQARTVVPDARISRKTVVELGAELLNTVAPEHVALGCMPSLNAYGIAGAPVENPRELKWRFSGGHYHLDPQDWKPVLSPAVAARMVKAADMFIGVPSVTMFQKYDNPVRRKYYGLPGEHRLPPHGVEYRVLSSAWILHPAATMLAMDLVREGLKLGMHDLQGLFTYDEDRVKKIILNGDVDEAIKHVQQNEKYYRAILGPRIKKNCNDWYNRGYGAEGGGKKVLEATIAALQKPIDEFLSTDNVEENWHLFKDDWEGHSRAKGATWWRQVLGQ